jgi:hypothetical protein
MTRDEVKQQVWDNVKQQLQLPEEAETRDSLVNLARLQEDTEVVLVGWTKKRHSLDRAAG